jgi:hypothetical protein
MKKNGIILMALIGFLLAASAAIGKTENLVYNGGFDLKKTDTLPSGWNIRVLRDTSAECRFDEVEKHSGRYAYMIDIKPPGGNVTLNAEASIDNVTPGKTYRLSVWVKAKNLGYSPNFQAPAIRFNFRPERVTPVPTIDLMSEMKGVNDWKNLTFTAIAPPNGRSITLALLFTNGTVWIDDLAITEVDTQQ